MVSKAISIIDMTNDFVKYNYTIDGDSKKYKGKLVVPAARSTIEYIQDLIYAGKKANTPIIYLQDEHTRQSEEIKKWGPHCMKGTPGALTIEELRIDYDNSYLVKKDHHNGFTNPELNKLLKNKGISEIYVAGVVQEICIDANVENFLDHGYKANVVVDGTAPFSAYKGYEALKKLERKGARMIDLETAIREVKDG